MIVVFDTNVVVSAAFWAGSADRRCFALVAKRKISIVIFSGGSSFLNLLQRSPEAVRESLAARKAASEAGRSPA